MIATTGSPGIFVLGFILGSVLTSLCINKIYYSGRKNDPRGFELSGRFCTRNHPEHFYLADLPPITEGRNPGDWGCLFTRRESSKGFGLPGGTSADVSWWSLRPWRFGTGRARHTRAR